MFLFVRFVGNEATGHCTCDYGTVSRYNESTRNTVGQAHMGTPKGGQIIHFYRTLARTGGHKPPTTTKRTHMTSVEVLVSLNRPLDPLSPELSGHPLTSVLMIGGRWTLRGTPGSEPHIPNQIPNVPYQI